MRRQPIEGEKVSGNHTADKRLVSKIYKELTQLNTKNKNKIIWLKMARGIEKTFFQWRHINGQQVHEKVLNIKGLIIIIIIMIIYDKIVIIWYECHKIYII